MTTLEKSAWENLLKRNARERERERYGTRRKVKVIENVISFAYTYLINVQAIFSFYLLSRKTLFSRLLLNLLLPFSLLSSLLPLQSFTRKHKTTVTILRIACWMFTCLMSVNCQDFLLCLFSVNFFASRWDVDWGAIKYFLEPGNFSSGN